MLIDITEYLEHLNKELPHLNFVSLEKIQDYKEGSEIYEIGFEKEVENKKIDFSYRMLVGHPDMEFSKEEQLANFVKIAELTYNNKMKEETEAEAETEEKKK